MRRWAAFDGCHPGAPGCETPNWNTRERNPLDVRHGTPERQRDLAGGGGHRDRFEPGGTERGMETPRPRRSTYPSRPDQNRACNVPRRGSERENSHYDPRQNRRPTIFVRNTSAREAPESAVESRRDFLGVQQTTAASPSGSLFWTTRPASLQALKRLNYLRARPRPAGRVGIALERGARLYRAPGQLSISQRVCRTAPDPGAPVQEGSLEHRPATAQPPRGEPSQLSAVLGAINYCISRWAP